MHRYTRLLLTGLAAAAILALTVGTATAGRLSLDMKEIRAVWSNLRLSNTIRAEAVECQVTLEGSFHSGTIQKVARTLIGHITRAQVNSCTGGSATIDQETLPWHVTYESFTGALPNIEAVTLLLIGASFLIRLGSLVCRAITTNAEPASGIAAIANRRITGLQADRNRRITLRTIEGFGCGLGRGFFEGTAAVTRLNETARPLITLI